MIAAGVKVYPPKPHLHGSARRSASPARCSRVGRPAAPGAMLSAFGVNSTGIVTRSRAAISTCAVSTPTVKVASLLDAAMLNVAVRPETFSIVNWTRSATVLSTSSGSRRNRKSAGPGRVSSPWTVRGSPRRLNRGCDHRKQGRNRRRRQFGTIETGDPNREARKASCSGTVTRSPPTNSKASALALSFA